MSRRLGLRARFIGLIVILLSAISVVITSVLININTDSLKRDLQNRATTFATLATAPIAGTYLTYKDSGTSLIGNQLSSFLSLDPTIARISVVDLDGSVQYSSTQGSSRISPTDASSFNPIFKYSNSRTIQQIIYPYIGPNGSHSYAVVYDVSSTEIDSAARKLVRSIIIDSLIALVLSAAVTYWFVNRLFLVPIKRVRDQAITIAAGNYDQAITRDRNDEIGDLALSVNQLADSLEADIQKLKVADQTKSEFMMIASHNLRSPLTIIDGYLDIAKTLSVTDDIRAVLDSIAANSKRLGIFAEDLLTISNLETGQQIFSNERLSVSNLVESIAADFKTLARDKKITFTSEISNMDSSSADFEIRGSKPHLRGAIWNLLDNALKFTSENGTILLKLDCSNDQARISVSDTGIGISEEEIPKLFTKFHRATSTLEYNYEGTGIGLYVTKLIITEHGGTIAVDSQAGKGSTFTISLPSFSQSEAKKSETNNG